MTINSQLLQKVQLSLNVIIIICFRVLVFVLSNLFPKKKNKIIFGSWFGEQYTDSPRYIYEYVRTLDDWDAIWITRSEQVLQKGRSNGLCMFHADSIIGIYHQLTAKIFICCVNSRDINPFAVSYRTQLIQLNHGMPIKGSFEDRFTKFQTIKNFIRRKTIDRYFLVASAHKFFDAIIMEQWKIDEKHLITMPMARCDAMNLSNLEIKNIKRTLNIHKKIILYAPTHRDEGQTIDDIYSAGVSLSNIIRRPEFYEYVLIIKPHFYDYKFKNKLAEISTTIRIVTDEIEINQLLAISDVLVGDYSGVVFDFSYLKKPVIGYCPDVKEYISKHRELYFHPTDIYEVTPSNEDDLAMELLSILNQKYIDKQWVKINLNDDSYKIGCLSKACFEMIIGKL